MLKRLEAQNYKALGPELVGIDLGAVSVLVGANGSGKTSMIEVPAILAQSAASQGKGLAPAGPATELRSADPAELRDLLFYGRRTKNWLRLGIEFSQEQEVSLPAHPGWKGRWPPLSLGLKVETRGAWDEADWIQTILADGQQFARWSSIRNTELGSRAWKNVYTMVGLEGAPANAPWADRVLDLQLYQGLSLQQRELYVNLEFIFERLRQLLKESISYVSPVRGQPLMERKVGPSPVRVGKHGEETLKLLSLIFGHTGDAANLLERWAPLFGLHDLRAGWAGQDILGLSFKDPQSRTTIDDLSFAGSGSKQVLPVLVELARSPSGNTVFLDEPDISLHPEWILALAKVIAEASQRGVQVVIATQTPSLVIALASCVGDGLLDRHALRIWEFKRDAERAIATEIEVTSHGHLKSWPERYAAADRALLKGVLGVEAKGSATKQDPERSEDRPRRRRVAPRIGGRRTR